MTPAELLTDARAALARGERDSARTLLAQLIETDPSNTEAWTLLVEVQDDPALQVCYVDHAKAAGVMFPEPSASETVVPTVQPRRRRSRRRRRQLLVAGVLALVLMIGVGSYLGYQILRPNVRAMLGPQPTPTLWIPPTAESTPLPTVEPVPTVLLQMSG